MQQYKGAEIQWLMQQHKEFFADRTHQPAHQLDSHPKCLVIFSDCWVTFNHVHPLMDFSCTFLIIITIRHPN
jgi:hypothetical protein